MDKENLVPTVQPKWVAILTIIDTFLITGPRQIHIDQIKKEEMGGFIFLSLVRENICCVLSRKVVKKFGINLDINWTLNKKQPVGSDEYIFSASFGRKWETSTHAVKAKAVLLSRFSTCVDLNFAGKA
jgi:hypothetical protein